MVVGGQDLLRAGRLRPDEVEQLLGCVAKHV